MARGLLKQNGCTKNKKDERGIVIRNKARLVAQGYTQEEGIDYDEVFAPVARIEEIRLFLAYASFKDFVVYQMDVKSAFLYGKIEEEVYVCQPPRFEDPEFPDKVYKKEMCTEFEKMMHKKFQMSSMGELTFFLGLQVTQKDDGIFISQDKYVDEILKKFGFSTVKTASTPMETSKPLMKDENAKDVDVHLYRSMIGSLMYLTSSRPDIMFADSPFDLEAYTDSDYAGASLDRKSTTGGCQFLGSRLISWQCKKQTVVANSTTEAEYVAASNCCGQIEIRHHFIKDSYEKRLIQVTKIHIDHNVIDLLTKAFDVSHLTFADSHNMVAYLEKSEANVDFAKIVDFLNSSPIRYALTVTVFNDEYDTPSYTKKVFANMRRQGKDFSGTVTPLFATMLIQSQAVEGEDSGQPTEPQHTPTIASPSHLERATTTATSLDAEQDSGLEITNLKKRVKKLEKKKKSRTPQLKRRLFKVRIDSITKKSLGDQEDASKQERNEIDQDEGISWFQEDAETPGRYGHDISTAEVTTVSVPSDVDVSAASPTRPIDDSISDDITLAETLMKIKSSASRSQKDKGVMFKEPSEPTTTSRPQPQIPVKDKGKGIMQEPEKPVKVKGKDQIKYDADVAQRLQAELDKEARLEREREEESSNAALIEEWDSIEVTIDVDRKLAE
ncbi:copia protein [Tanacetum coccineum]